MISMFVLTLLITSPRAGSLCAGPLLTCISTSGSSASLILLFAPTLSFT